MANAQFHKGDFNSSASTSTYIMRHFADEKKVYDKAAILLARSYKELNWLYEAENVLNDLNNSSLTPSQTGAFSAAYADFLIERKQYAEAIPLLTLAIKNDGNKKEKQRWMFLLGQLYQATDQREEANKVYSTIPSMNPPYEMEISARIRQTEVFPGNNPAKPLKKLRRLSHKSKNKNYLDQIFYAMGNLYLAEKDTIKAIEHFHLSLDKSTLDGPHKLKTLLVLGDLQYRTEHFLEAAPCYAEAAVMLKKEDPRYEEAAFRAGVLKELAPPLKTVHDEDSLQFLAKLPKKKLDVIIDSLVTAAEKKAKEEKRKKNAEDALNANQEMADANQKQDETKAIPDIQDPTNRSWYFYNTNAVSKGLTEFRKKWGKRLLADDWRRNKKTAIFEDTGAETKETALKKDSLASADTSAVDTTTAKSNKQVVDGGDDPLKPNYYLKNIPFTEEQVAASNEKITDALFNAGKIYRELMGDDRLALSTFSQLEHRFPECNQLENAWYISYLALKQAKQDALADSARVKLIRKFPESPLAIRLKDALFIEHLIEMYQKQDTLYENTYAQFKQHRTDSLFVLSHFVEQKYPLSQLRPRFLFLEAMEYGQIGQPDSFHVSLLALKKDYPDCDLIPVVNEMLAYWDKGRRPVPSAGYISLFSKDSLYQTDEKQRLDSLKKQLKYDPSEAHVLLIQYTDSTNTNRLLYDVALYNFTTFLIRDYELSLAKVGQMDVLLIQGFENAADVLRYRSWITFQNVSPETKYPGIRLIVTSVSNLKLLEQGLDPELYLTFYKQHYKTTEPN